ncbi:MAG TPA: YceI family protein, partial [Candidatus Saccharimonadales bacterium]|nr:YceI family protein [Candidatus Saccharimonadales bacterium]
ILVAAPPARAADLLRLDPAATSVAFELGSTFHTVHGSFDLARGEIWFDAGTGEASGRIEIPTASGQSGNKSRDRKMHEEILESARYPAIVFQPDRFEGSFDPASGGKVSLAGAIEIHGASHRISVPAEVSISGVKLTGTARLTIPYVEWGMKDPSVLFLRARKEVEVTIHLEGSIQREAPAPDQDGKLPAE